MVGIRFQSPATNRSLVLHASWSLVTVGREDRQGTMTNADLGNNISAFVSQLEESEGFVEDFRIIPSS